MSKGTINVSVNNIFPLIKKFLYSDHEIFLRELVSNATDATLKLKHLIDIGQAPSADGDPKIEIKIDSKHKTLHVLDQGIGMTKEEVEKYINEIAFSGAQEFLDTYKEGAKDTGIIGHFGLGFYSAFMVASKVEIISKSYKDGSEAVHWQCDGSPEYTLEPADRTDRGTEIILHITDKDSKEFLEETRIRELLLKYNKFMPVPIKFGTKTETKKTGEGDQAKEETIETDDIINNPHPAWIKQLSELKDEDYEAFYRELYPMNFEKPIFHVHLNIDYPFHLTGILFFPKIGHQFNVQKDRIQLYQNQVFVTDHVEGIVPEFLTFLRGVVDSPDIPLNVSRSYLQADGNVKKISAYISKKVADKLSSLFKKDRSRYQEKWNDVKPVIEYGMLSDDKFYEKASEFALYPTTNNEYYTLEELKEKVKSLQTDKDGNIVLIYTSDAEAQHHAIDEVKAKGYEVLLLNSPIAPHWIQKIETSNDKISFVRVDADHADNLIKKEDTAISKLSDQQKEALKKEVEEAVPKGQFVVQIEPMDSALPFLKITQPEFMRRMKDMQALGGGMFGMDYFPETYNLSINANHPLAETILNSTDPDKKKNLIHQSVDLAKLSQGLLKGEALTNFVKRSYELIK